MTSLAPMPDEPDPIAVAAWELRAVGRVVHETAIAFTVPDAIAFELATIASMFESAAAGVELGHNVRDLAYRIALRTAHLARKLPAECDRAGILSRLLVVFDACKPHTTI